MEILVARSAGFCFGVKKAVEMTETLLEKERNIYSLGHIIHNSQVINSLTGKGLVTVDSLSEIPPKGKLVLRAHGVGMELYKLLARLNIEYTDLTCAFVKKIHRIVQMQHEQGRQIIIIGNKNHPEVIGINGWCNNTAVVSDNPDEISSLINPELSYSVVCQTTMELQLSEKMKKIINNLCTDVVMFDTICNATSVRQQEAAEIAKSVDLMLIIGDFKSSNTIKLTNVCKLYCKNCLQIESVKDLPEKLTATKIGITAGASTPAWIIKEVIRIMAEQKSIFDSEELSFEEEVEKSMVTLTTGDVVTGTVISITPTEIYVNLGSKSDGFIPISELSDDPALKPEDIVKVGEEIEAFVVRVNDVEGTVMLSKKKLDNIRGWQEVERVLETQEIIEGKVVEVVNGGVIVLACGTRVFVPASQANDRFLTDLTVLLNKKVPLRIIDVNRRKRKIVGSIRGVLEEQRQINFAKFWEDVDIGKHYTGVVKSLTSFGAFVDVGGVDGLVHISELSWNKIKHPSDVLKINDEIDVYIIDFNRENNKVSLGYKKMEDNPWEIAKRTLKIDDVVRCKIVRMMPFGAFAEIIPGIDGLVHISQISNTRIAKPSDVLEIGDVVDAKIVEIDWDRQKISLSIRELLPDLDVVDED